MKYDIGFRNVEGYSDIVFEFVSAINPINGYLISNSLGSDIYSDFNLFSNTINKYIQLLENKINKYEEGGNVNFITSDKEYTIIEDPYENIICKIETIEFIEILLLWAAEEYTYKNSLDIVNKEEYVKRIDWIKEQQEKIKNI